MRSSRPKRGFTVLELMATTAVVAIALIASAGAVLRASELERENSQMRAAAPALATLLDEVRGTPFDNVQSTFSNTTRSVTGIPGISTPATALFTVSDITTGSTRWLVKKVSVKLSWSGYSGTFSISGSTYCSDRPGTGSAGLTPIENGGGNN